MAERLEVGLEECDHLCYTKVVLKHFKNLSLTDLLSCSVWVGLCGGSGDTWMLDIRCVGARIACLL